MGCLDQRELVVLHLCKSASLFFHDGNIQPVRGRHGNPVGSMRMEQVRRRCKIRLDKASTFVGLSGLEEIVETINEQLKSARYD